MGKPQSLPHGQMEAPQLSFEHFDNQMHSDFKDVFRMFRYVQRCGGLGYELPIAQLHWLSARKTCKPSMVITMHFAVVELDTNFYWKQWMGWMWMLPICFLSWVDLLFIGTFKANPCGQYTQFCNERQPRVVDGWCWLWLGPRLR